MKNIQLRFATNWLACIAAKSTFLSLMILSTVACESSNSTTLQESAHKTDIILVGDCADGQWLVETQTDCLQEDDAVCNKIGTGDETCWCTGPAVPSCDEGCDTGHYEVQSQTDCLLDDAVCYQTSACGQEIWCTGEAA